MNLTIQKPKKEHGHKVWQLIKDSENLDLNSSYYYFILCDFYKDYCAVVKDEETGNIVGFLSGLIPPNQPGTLFVWQVSVASSARKRGLAKRMLQFVLENNKDIVTTIQTTISPDNAASDALFQSIAQQYGATVETTVYLDTNDFDHENHETELLYTIQPLKF